VTTVGFVLTIFPPHTALFGSHQTGNRTDYLAALDAHCGWAERLGAAGMLIYEFRGSLEPWMAATAILARTSGVAPVVAANTRRTHPEAAAQRIAALVFLHGRRVDLNLVTGAKTGELDYYGPELGDKYVVAADFAAGLAASLAGADHEGPVFRLPPGSGTPKVGADQMPRLFAPASHNDGFAKLAGLLSHCLVMAKPAGTLGAELERLAGLGFGGEITMLAGVIARETDEAARDLALTRYASTRRDALVRRAFRSSLTSSQHTATFAQAEAGTWHDDCLWYGAGRIGIDGPKLVGSYDTVATALARYRDLGVGGLVVDLPDDPGEYAHIQRAIGGWPR
jgi:alkanesulfonate monooxygenase